jgi:hypothetical protein
MPLKGEGKHEKVRRSRPSPGIIASDSSAAQQFVRRGGRQTPNHTMQLTGVLFLMDHCRQSLRPKLVFDASKNRRARLIPVIMTPFAFCHVPVSTTAARRMVSFDRSLRTGGVCARWRQGRR